MAHCAVPYLQTPAVPQSLLCGAEVALPSAVLLPCIFVVDPDRLLVGSVHQMANVLVIEYVFTFRCVIVRFLQQFKSHSA